MSISTTRKRVGIGIATLALAGGGFGGYAATSGSPHGAPAAKPASKQAQQHKADGSRITTQAGAAAGQPGVAAASGVSCSGWKSIRTKGNAAGARYMECDRKVNGHRQTSAALYLWDNKHDGKSAQAYVLTGYTHWYGDFTHTWQHYYGWSSERHHSPKLITGWHGGNDVRVTLYTR